MTPQEIFDTVSTHLFTQGHPATTDGGMCVYRAHNGDMCAVGCLIQDYYVPEMDQDLFSEGTGVYRLLNKFGNILPDWMRKNDGLLFDLQCIHDNYDTWHINSFLKYHLNDIAEKYSLDSTILDKFDKFGHQG